MPFELHEKSAANSSLYKHHLWVSSVADRTQPLAIQQMAIGQRWVSSSERAIGYLSYSLVATSQDKRQWSKQMTPFSILNVTFQICFSLPPYFTNAVRPTSLLSTLKKNLSLGEGGEGFARPANIQCPLDTSTTIREIMGWKKGENRPKCRICPSV